MRFVWPREHGAWGILLVPFLSAVVIASRFTLPVLLALVAVLFAFLARYPWELMLVPRSRGRPAGLTPTDLHRCAWLYSLAAAAVGGFLVVAWSLYALVPLAALAGLTFAARVWTARRGRERNGSAEVLGAAGLTLSALVAWVAATGRIDQSGVLVWLLNCAFFSSGIVYVKSRIQGYQAARKSDRNSANGWVIGFHVAILLFVFALIFARLIPSLVVVPFGVAVARAAWGTRRGHEGLALRRLGWSEVALSLLFAGFLTVGFRL